MLQGLSRCSNENLLVGFDTSDDACVYRIREDLAAIQTVDFFPPVVDDPYLYGQIAAANALSDLYAMGADVTMALNILCIPSCLPPELVKGILEGGQSKVTEAGGIIAGGHSVEDNEPKYGLCATGFLHPDKVWFNANAQPGDVLILTKALGSGILTTAAKADLLSEEAFSPTVDSMTTLNKYAKDAAVAVGIHACTDITGFGMLGHTCEMAQASGVTILLFADQHPLLPQAAEMARMGIVPQGAYRNRDYLAGQVSFQKRVPLHLQDILFDPQTSGGLLLSVAESKSKELLSRLEEVAPHSRMVGLVLPQKNLPVMVE